MIQVVLCDDHKIVRDGLSKIIGSFNDIDVIADDIASGEELLQRLRKTQPDVIILDVSLPGRSGLEVLKQIKIFYPDIKVLVLSMYPEDQFAIRMLKAGASGYLHKDSAPEVLIEAIRTIQNGGEYLFYLQLSIFLMHYFYFLVLFCNLNQLFLDSIIDFAYLFVFFGIPDI